MSTEGFGVGGVRGGDFDAEDAETQRTDKRRAGGRLQEYSGSRF